MGKIPLLIKAVEYAVNSSLAERIILPDLIFKERGFFLDRFSFKLRARLDSKFKGNSFSANLLLMF